MLCFAPFVFVCVVAEEEEFLVVVSVAATLTEGLPLLTEYPAHLKHRSQISNNQDHNPQETLILKNITGIYQQYRHFHY